MKSLSQKHNAIRALNLAGLCLTTLLFVACGSGPNLDTSEVNDVFADGKNPVGLLEARAAKESNTAQFGQAIGYEYHANQYCTAFLREDGMILTESDCVHNAKKRKAVETGQIRAYFRLPSDSQTEEIKIKRVVASGVANSKNWVVLEPDNRFTLLAKYGGLALQSHQEAMAEGETTIETKIVSIIPPTSSGETKYAIHTGTITNDFQIETAIRERAQELMRISNTRLLLEDALKEARRNIEADPASALSAVPRVGIRIREAREFSSAGGVVLRDGKVVAIMPRSINKGKDRQETASRVGNLPF